MASRKQELIEHITERCLIAQKMKKNLVSRNELRQIENIGARDVDVLIDNFLLQVREFLFLINLFPRCLCRKPLLARSSLVRVFDTNNSCM